ncbi:MAG TPA: MBL fold metallo-hydrolase [Polyangiaceae bacterium]|nr:MBL fold metallo-hydrolase [Polyangiaceae bacterium]
MTRAGDSSLGIRDGHFRVHTQGSDADGFYTNAFLVETAKSVVVVDTLMRVSDARVLRMRAESLRKPLVAILITHGHPDHYNGVTELAQGRGLPVVATAGTAETIRETDAAKAQQWEPIYRHDWPVRRTFPNESVREGDSLEWDGVRFTVRDLGPGESHADSCWLVGDSNRVAFVGDVVFAGVHSFMKDGHTRAWLENLAMLGEELRGIRHIYTGHGAPMISLDALETQAQYLTLCRETIRRLAGGARALDPNVKLQVIETMKRALVTDRLEGFLAASLEAVANELAIESETTIGSLE